MLKINVNVTTCQNHSQVKLILLFIETLVLFVFGMGMCVLECRKRQNFTTKRKFPCHVSTTSVPFFFCVILVCFIFESLEKESMIVTQCM